MDVSYLLKLVMYSSSWTFGYTIPMSTLLAIIIAMGGLNSDSEIIAMRAGGITYPRIFRPFFFFGIFITIFLLWFNQQIIPESFYQMRVIGKEIWTHDPIAILEEGKFTLLDKTENSHRYIYLEKIRKNPENPLEDIIYNIQIRKLDRSPGGFRTTRFIIAQRGKKINKIHKASGKSVRTLRLFNGYVLTTNKKNNTFQRIDFNEGFMDVHIADNSGDKVELEREFTSFTYSELNRYIDEKIPQENVLNEKEKEELHKVRMEFHKRLALPFAALAFLFIGFPVSIVNRRSGKGMGLGISVFIIFLYFIFFLTSDSISRKLSIHPMVAAWNANFIMTALGAFFYSKRTSDLNLSDQLNEIIKKIKGYFKKNGKP